MVMQFCKLHNLELSTSFLRECAKSNEWLQFLIQTQLHGHQPAQVSCLFLGFSSLRMSIPWDCGSPSLAVALVNLI